MKTKTKKIEVSILISLKQKKVHSLHQHHALRHNPRSKTHHLNHWSFFMS